MKKPATSDFELLPAIGERWSPRAFADRALSREQLGSVLEAIRWAPSCFNEQPWRICVARREDGESFDRLAACLVEGNAWAKKAGALLLAVAKTRFDRNGNDNRHAFHDVGLALGQAGVQVQALGLAMHQMAGFDVEAARTKLAIPEGFEPITMAALGHPGDAEDLDGPLAEREKAPRSRLALGEIAFANWGASYL